MKTLQDSCNSGFKTARALVFCGMLTLMFGLAECSQATVIYSGILNNGGNIVDFTIPGGDRFTFNANTEQVNTWLAGTWMLATVPNGTVAEKLTFGSLITSSLAWSSQAVSGLSMANFGLWDSGYVAFNDSMARNGWIQVENVGGGDYVIRDYAYQSNAGVAIHAGQTSDSPAVPEPSSVMLLLSAVAVGFPIYRRFRKTN